MPYGATCCFVCEATSAQHEVIGLSAEMVSVAFVQNMFHPCIIAHYVACQEVHEYVALLGGKCKIPSSIYVGCEKKIVFCKHLIDRSLVN